MVVKRKEIDVVDPQPLALNSKVRHAIELFFGADFLVRHENEIYGLWFESILHRIEPSGGYICRERGNGLIMTAVYGQDYQGIARWVSYEDWDNVNWDEVEVVGLRALGSDPNAIRNLSYQYRGATPICIGLYQGYT